MDNHLQRNFQFSDAPAVRQVHEQAHWHQRRQPAGPMTVEQLTDQQQHLLRQTAAPATLPTLPLFQQTSDSSGTSQQEL